MMREINHTRRQRIEAVEKEEKKNIVEFPTSLYTEHRVESDYDVEDEYYYARPGRRKNIDEEECDEEDNRSSWDRDDD